MNVDFEDLGIYDEEEQAEKRLRRQEEHCIGIPDPTKGPHHPDMSETFNYYDIW